MNQGKVVLRLEDYVDFFNGKNEQALTTDQLNKIVLMNGFVKPRRFAKPIIRDMLRAVDLIPPSRSTIGDFPVRSSTCAGLSLEEVVKDIAMLGWGECPIGSILTIGDNEAVADTAPISSSCESKRVRKNKRGSGGTPTIAEAKGNIKRKLEKSSHGELLKLPSVE